jgi:hypothetical protein
MKTVKKKLSTSQSKKKPLLKYWLMNQVSTCGLRVEYVKMYYYE